MTFTESPVGITPAAWANDALRRFEDLVSKLNRAPLTLEQLERYERAVVRAHAENLMRVSELVPESEQ